jgi:hypothetical protein
MIFDIDSIQIFWKAAACSAVFSKLSLIGLSRSGAARAPLRFPAINLITP